MNLEKITMPFGLLKKEKPKVAQALREHRNAGKPVEYWNGAGWVENIEGAFSFKITYRAVRQYLRNQADAIRLAEAQDLEARRRDLAERRAVIKRLEARRRGEWGAGYADYIANMVDAAELAGRMRSL